MLVPAEKTLCESEARFSRVDIFDIYADPSRFGIGADRVISRMGETEIEAGIRIIWTPRRACLGLGPDEFGAAVFEQDFV